MRIRENKLYLCFWLDIFLFRPCLVNTYSVLRRQDSWIWFPFLKEPDTAEADVEIQRFFDAVINSLMNIVPVFWFNISWPSCSSRADGWVLERLASAPLAHTLRVVFYFWRVGKKSKNNLTTKLLDEKEIQILVSINSFYCSTVTHLFAYPPGLLSGHNRVVSLRKVVWPAKLKLFIVFPFVETLLSLSFFFFSPHLWHVEVPGPEFEPMLEQWQCWNLNLLRHKGTPVNPSLGAFPAPRRNCWGQIIEQACTEFHLCARPCPGQTGSRNEHEGQVLTLVELTVWWETVKKTMNQNQIMKSTIKETWILCEKMD